MKIVYLKFHFAVEFPCIRETFIIHLMSIKFGWSGVGIVMVREVVDEGQFKDARTSGQRNLC